MPAFGDKSRKILSTCHPDLIRLMEAAITDSPVDFTVLCGHRTKAEQDDAVRRKASKTPYPKSRHNSFPAEAVDIVPYPIDWQDLGRFRTLAVHVKQTAQRLGIKVTWGGDWKKFVDMPHWELPK